MYCQMHSLHQGYPIISHQLSFSLNCHMMQICTHVFISLCVSARSPGHTYAITCSNSPPCSVSRPGHSHATSITCSDSSPCSVSPPQVAERHYRGRALAEEAPGIFQRRLGGPDQPCVDRVPPGALRHRGQHRSVCRGPDTLLVSTLY